MRYINLHFTYLLTDFIYDVAYAGSWRTARCRPNVNGQVKVIWRPEGQLLFLFQLSPRLERLREISL